MQYGKYSIIQKNKTTMKKYLITLLLLTSLMGYSQKGHIGLSMGPAFPLNDFSNIDSYTSNGYATTGFNLSFEGNYIPTWYFGIGGALTFATNYPNQDSMLVGLIEVLREMDVPPIPEDIDAVFTIGNWSYINILVGPTLALPVGKLQFNLKALLGLSMVMPPNQTLNLLYNDNHIYTYSDVQTVSFCYNLGADIILKLNGNYSIKFGTEYFHTSTEYDVEFSYNDSSLPIIKRSIDIDAIHSTVGLAYLF